jgi:putative phosphoribosyl transferase
MAHETASAPQSTATIPADGVLLEGDLTVPSHPGGIVVFAHGSGSGRFSPRNRAVANVLVNAGLATLLGDLLTAEEDVADLRTGHLRFDAVLAREWFRRHLAGR